jgi:hypothetical protein
MLLLLFLTSIVPKYTLHDYKITSSEAPSVVRRTLGACPKITFLVLLMPLIHLEDLKT